jgi:hypothetical protein
MTVEQWNNLTPSHQAEVWGQLSTAERAAIITADSDVMKRVASATVEQLAGDPSPPAPGRVLPVAALPSPPIRARKVAPYEIPSMCAALNAIAICGLLGGLFVAVWRSDLYAGIVSIAFLISLLVWSQILDNTARSAHYTKQTAELLAAQSSAPSV